jgi:hypothetical protein
MEGALGYRLTAIYSDYVRKKIVYLRQLVAQSNNESNKGSDNV